MNYSIWQETVKIPKFPCLGGDEKTEVLIVGGGLTGILCAHALDRAGVDYLLIEAGEVCGGVTGNTTAKLTSQHGLCYHKLLKQSGPETARLYWEANQEALGRYRTLSQGIPCDFEEKDAYVYALADPVELRQEAQALERLGIPGGVVESLPLPFPVAGAIRFSNQAQFNPLKFVSALAGGLNIRQHTEAQSFEGNLVRTNHGDIRAKHIVIATHFPIINRHGGYFLKMYQHRSYVLALEGAADVDGMYVDASGQGLSFRNYNGLLLLGGGAHRTGKQGGGWAELETASQAFYPEAREVCRWATQDCMTLDGVPYIGRYGRRLPGYDVATGFGKWGMTSAMVSAMILSDLIQGKENPYARVFDPARRMLLPQLLSNIGQATVNLLTPTTPRCPHLGCALKWNPQEHTWDCPCHGSRFGEDGTLLENPATGDLKKPNR